MKELPRTNGKVANLLADGVRKKPPLSMKVRDTVRTDLSSSRPNSTASEGGASTDGDDEENLTTECSESCHDDDEEDDEEDDDEEDENDDDDDEGLTSSEEEGVGRGVPLDPISEEASLILKQSDEEHGYIF